MVIFITDDIVESCEQNKDNGRNRDTVESSCIKILVGEVN